MTFKQLVPWDLSSLIGKPSLLAITIAAAAISAVANAVAVATPPAESSPPTRLGTAIQQTMRDRDRQAADRERALDMREQAQRAVEQRMQNSARQQAGDPATLPQSGGVPAPTPNQLYDELAKIYQAMKPTKAAPIFEKLGVDVQIQVARRMRNRETALLLANMSPEAAADLSMALAGHPVPKAPPPRPVAVRIVPAQTLPASRQGAAQGRAPRAVPAAAAGAPAPRRSGAAAPAPQPAAAAPAQAAT